MKIFCFSSFYRRLRNGAEEHHPSLVKKRDEIEDYVRSFSVADKETHSLWPFGPKLS